MNTSRYENPDFWQNSFIRRLRYEHGYTTGVFGKLLNVMSSYGCDGSSPTVVHGLDRTQARAPPPALALLGPCEPPLGTVRSARNSTLPLRILESYKFTI